MGIRDALSLTTRAGRYEAAITAAAAQLPAGITSPWATTELERIVADDVFGSNRPANTRAAAMRIPAIARARNLMVSTISRFPLRNMRGADPTPAQAPWLSAPGHGQSPQLRMAWTVDDLMFYGWSLWARDYEAGTAHHVNYSDWEVTQDNELLVHGVEAKPEDVIVIPGLHEGVLTYGVESLEDTRALYRNVRARLLNPVPQIDLHQTAGAPMTPEEIDRLIARWAKARQGSNGGVSYTNPSIEARELGGTDAQLMIEARNAAALDCARLIGVHGGLIDATTATASLNYETQQGRNQEFVDFDLALYMTPVTARLSLDDVSAPGDHTAFDLADFTSALPSGTGPDLED